MTLIQINIAIGILAFAVSASLTWVMIKFSTKIGFAARPTADRYHRTIIPLGGGAAIFVTIAGFLALSILALKIKTSALSEDVTIHRAGFDTKIPQLLVVIGCMCGLFVLGLWDDIKRLGPYFKLFVQFIIAIAAAYFADIRVELFIENKIITSIMSAFWIVLIINVFNFLDNMDGASAGIAVIAAVYLLAAAVISEQVFVSATAVIFIGTLLGFLVFNFPPAKIFMGDAGSLVIGFVLAMLSLRTTYFHQAESGRWYQVFLPAIVMAVPLYDFLSVSFLRIKQRKSPFVGDTQHFSHRLRKRGLSDRQTALTLYLATLCTGLGSLFLYQVSLLGAILIFVQTFLILAIVAIFEGTKSNETNN